MQRKGLKRRPFPCNPIPLETETSGPPLRWKKTASLRFAPEDFYSVLCLTIPIPFATITPPASLRSDHLIGNPQEC